MMSQSIISLLGNISVCPSGKKISISNSACQRYSPKIEKKIMKTAEIWITLRLPTRVSPISPTFSLQKSANIKNQTQDKSNIHSCQAKEQILFFLP
jgi:hypothetical protein